MVYLLTSKEEKAMDTKSINFNILSYVSNVYKATFPEDAETARWIKQNVTFAHVAAGLMDNENPYDIVGDIGPTAMDRVFGLLGILGIRVEKMTIYTISAYK